MTEATRRECTPQDYIRKLFEETEGGVLTIQHFPLFESPYCFTYRMSWVGKDAIKLIEEYNNLTAALTRIGGLHRKLEDEASCKKLLTEEEFSVWHTYIRPFEAFEVDLDIIANLYFRSETDSLKDEEYDLLERHHDWFVENSHRRLPFDRWCPAQLINRAQRYEKLVEMAAAQSALEEEGRLLAEELALYRHATKKLSFDSLKFIIAQSKTYATALQQVKNGKKQTHWMWFIFPQLRGLGSSSTANIYAIADLDEARAYLSHNVLGARLIEISAELLKLDENNPQAIFGEVDALKLKSSMTLFALISDDDSVFHKVLQKFFKGQRDYKTLEILKG